MLKMHIQLANAFQASKFLKMFFQKFNFSFFYPIFILLHLTIGQNILYSNAFKNESASLIDAPQTSMVSFTTNIFRFTSVYFMKIPHPVQTADNPFYTSLLPMPESVNVSDFQYSDNNTPLNPLKGSMDILSSEPDISVSKDSSETKLKNERSISQVNSISDSVAQTLLSISDLNLVYVDSSYHETDENYLICYNETTTQNSHSGPYSQSVSNLKDY
jgi:hypothetical protein